VNVLLQPGWLQWNMVLAPDPVILMGSVRSLMFNLEGAGEFEDIMEAALLWRDCWGVSGELTLFRLELWRTLFPPLLLLKLDGMVAGVMFEKDGEFRYMGIILGVPTC
jgi:hypothetical protein